MYVSSFHTGKFTDDAELKKHVEEILKVLRDPEKVNKIVDDFFADPATKSLLAAFEKPPVPKRSEKKKPTK